MSDRGQHPDLIDDEQPAAPAAETPSPPRRGRAARAAAASPPGAAAEASTPAARESEPATGGADTPPSDAQAAAEPPEWLQSYKDAETPEAALAVLVKNLPKQVLEQDPTLQGWIGDMGARRARAMLQDNDREARERQKREALANADYYGLGQLTASEVRAQVEQSQAGQQLEPFMNAVAVFQSKQPPEVQQQVQGKTYGAGKSAQEGFVEYLEAVNEASVSHRLNDAVEKEIKRREPALRKAWLSESNGGAPVPELDGGRASSVREITDEQVGRMSLAEYDQHFDERGQPRPGTRVRLTRGISLQRR
jgi:hypothetical protein